MEKTDIYINIERETVLRNFTYSSFKRADHTFIYIDVINMYMGYVIVNLEKISSYI